MSEGYTDINARVIDGWVVQGWQWGLPITPEAYQRALQGELKLLLTPLKWVPESWFPPLKGLRVLGLAAGGAQQMPVFAAHGAHCTVLDYSIKQLESERMVAEREGYAIDIVRHDMARPLPFPDAAFDLIFHPVSNCYVEQVLPIWRECYRVLQPGGLLIAGVDTGLNYLFDEREDRLVHPLPYNPLKDPALMAQGLASGDGVQFSHTLEEQLGGQLKAGFILTDLYEDTNGGGKLQAFGVPSFLATRACKPK